MMYLKILFVCFLFSAITLSAQDEHKVDGVYETYDIGEWNRRLLLFADSTYLFEIITDLGSTYYEPENFDTVYWSYDHKSGLISLHGNSEYQPVITELYSQDSMTLRDSKYGLWEKRLELYPNKHLKTFYHLYEETVVHFAEAGYATEELIYKKGQLKKKIYFQIPEQSVLDQIPKWIPPFYRPLHNQYSLIYGYYFLLYAEELKTERIKKGK